MLDKIAKLHINLGKVLQGNETVASWVFSSRSGQEYFVLISDL